MLKVECPQPSCRAPLLFASELAGQTVNCGRCNAPMRLPALPAPAKQTDIQPPELPIFTPIDEPKTPPKNLLPLTIVLGGVAGLMALMLMAVVINNAIRRPRAKPPMEPTLSLPHASTADDDRERQRAEDREAARKLLDMAYTTPRLMGREVSANTVAAEKKYKGRLVHLKGEVNGVLKNNQGLPMAVFRTDSFMLVRVFILDSDVDSFAKVKPGDEISVIAEFVTIEGNLIDLRGGFLCDDAQLGR